MLGRYSWNAVLSRKRDLDITMQEMDEHENVAATAAPAPSTRCAIAATGTGRAWGCALHARGRSKVPAVLDYTGILGSLYVHPRPSGLAV